MGDKGGLGDEAARRIDRLRAGYPLSDSRTPAEPPKTRGGRRPAIDPGKRSAEKVRDKAAQKKELEGQ